MTFLKLLNTLLSVGQEVKSENDSQGSVINGTDWFDLEGRPIKASEDDIAEFEGIQYSQQNEEGKLFQKK